MQNTNSQDDTNLFTLNTETFFPGISIDCVILGFHNREIKILLNKYTYINNWMLPGGFVYRNEDVNLAANRILSDRTGLRNVFLRQFYTFGDCNRTNIEENTNIIEKAIPDFDRYHWFLQRFISVGYYALVDYSKANISVNDKSDEVKWFNLDEVPQLYADHNKIIQKAFWILRHQIDYIPIGYQLLPEKFALSELRVIYEKLLGKPLDRRNFQRKILSLNVIEKLNEVAKYQGKRSTTLYRFNKERYIQTSDNGVSYLNW